MAVIPTRLARELGVDHKRVLRLVKWYALAKGKESADFMRPYPYSTSRPVYLLPDDFRGFVIEELRGPRA